MRILLDTHIFLWLNVDDPKLTAAVRKLLDQAQEIYISSATFWELAIKISRGVLQADLEELRATVHLNGFTFLPISPEHACATAALPWHHRDPFDRMLVAQAISEPLRLLTADRQLEAYTDLVLRV